MSSKANKGTAPYPKGGHSKGKGFSKPGGGGGGVKKHQGKAAAEGGEGKKRTSQRDRIRLLQHLLKKDDLTGPPREAAQRELDQLLAAQAQAKRAEKERKLAARYHHVRFFERVKIERHIAHLQKLAAPAGPGLTAQQQQELAQWQADLQYVRHFPPGEKYVSLLKDATNPGDQAKLVAERNRLRALVAARVQAAAQAAADAAALTEADEGRQVAALHQEAVAAATAAAAAATGMPNKQNSKASTASKVQPQQAGKAPAAATGAAATSKSAAECSKSAAGTVKSVAVPVSEDVDNDDDEFFLSEDEDMVPVVANGKEGTVGVSRAAGLVAQAWQKPQQGEASGDDSGGEDDMPSMDDDRLVGGNVQQPQYKQVRRRPESEGRQDEEDVDKYEQGEGHKPGGKHKPRHTKRRKSSLQEHSTLARKQDTVLQGQGQRQQQQAQVQQKQKQKQQPHHNQSGAASQEGKKRRHRRRKKARE